MPRILVVDKVHPSGLELLRRRPGIAVETLEVPTPAALLHGARGADAIVIRTSPLPGDANAMADGRSLVLAHPGTERVPKKPLTARVAACRL